MDHSTISFQNSYSYHGRRNVDRERKVWEESCNERSVEDEPRVDAVDWRARYEQFRNIGHRLFFSSAVFFLARNREKALPTTMNHRPASPLLISRRLSAAFLSRLFRSPDRKRRNDRIFRTNIYNVPIQELVSRVLIGRSSPTTSPSFFSNPISSRMAPHQFSIHRSFFIARKDPSIHLVPIYLRKTVESLPFRLLITSHASSHASRSTSSRSPSHPQLNERSTLLYFAVAIFRGIGTRTTVQNQIFPRLPFSCSKWTHRSTLDL